MPLACNGIQSFQGSFSKKCLACYMQLTVNKTVTNGTLHVYGNTIAFKRYLVGHFLEFCKHYRSFSNKFNY